MGVYGDCIEDNGKENGNYYSILRTKFRLGVTYRELYRVVGGTY